jgi:hypothetical protein
VACCSVVASFAQYSLAAAAAIPRALMLAESLIRSGVKVGTELWAALAAVGTPSVSITSSPSSFNPQAVSKQRRQVSDFARLDAANKDDRLELRTTPPKLKAGEMCFPWD